MKVSVTLPDPAMPRTVFYQLFIEALERNPRFVADETQADVCFPAEDVANETNWPRYGNQASAYVRGIFDHAAYVRYLNRLVMLPKRLCVLNMHSQIRLPVTFASHPHVVTADITLSTWEHSLNPRTISMPALPVTVGNPSAAPRSILASFRGASSHPCRNAIIALHNGHMFVCQFVDTKNHWGRIDATTGAQDSVYSDVLSRSVFSFVPRGDSLFSYRLSEVLSFGCIPVIVADGWVLPFSRLVDWSRFAIHLPEQMVSAAPAVLKEFAVPRIQQMFADARDAYLRHLANLEVVVESLLQELELLLPIVKKPL